MTKLDRASVIRAALDLLDEVGVDGLTTRKLADRLDVQQPALYWHFRNKRALLDALAEAMLTQRHRRSLPVVGEDWQVFLKENAHSFRNALLAYRDGARIHAGTRPSAPQFGVIEAQIRFLCNAGFSPTDAAHALIAISHYTVGAVMEQQGYEANAPTRQMGADADVPEPSAFLQQLFDEIGAQGPDATFALGLDALVDGLEVRRAG
ncbi:MULTISPECIES: tetracycline resistance transcriptional repressor TetR [Pandoraea]|uniref:tetracycline resistance transcriptional repressor TetR n=1 Tax=Pandoraea sp. LA3 TaxID=2094120 RepID=UPI001F5CD3B0|nr:MULTISPECIES: tetracycline resistance transcriptional repressor TetR [Pandoraea]MCI3204355.1 TetR family transcriptional regulator [Pandoraea sp. LA3]MDN4582382.1 TetR family transcriptional regulator [Pandoraea capi]